MGRFLPSRKFLGGNHPNQSEKFVFGSPEKFTLSVLAAHTAECHDSNEVVFQPAGLHHLDLWVLWQGERAILTVWVTFSVLALISQPKNVAFNCPYSLQPSPNYPHCTDPDDRIQLTDGQYTRGYFWTQKSTVGWRNVSSVFIVVDLKRDVPISGVSFNTAAGVAGVSFPQAIWVFVSLDSERWFLVGDLV